MSMTCRYVGLVAWAGVATALLLVAHTSEPRHSWDVVGSGDAAVARRQMQVRDGKGPTCFKGDNCDSMSYADAVSHCASLDGHLCTADELQTFTPSAKQEDASGGCIRFAERAVWAADTPPGLTCGVGEQAYRVPTPGEPPCRDSCTSLGDDCCAPDGELATCAGGASAVPIGWCSNDPEGQYMCCDPATASSYMCAAGAAQQPVVCCKEKPFRENHGTRERPTWAADDDGCTADGHGDCVAGYDYTGRADCVTACTSTSSGEVVTIDSFEGWMCPEYDEDHNAAVVLLSILPSLIFTIGPLFISCCCCHHFRNKSLATAPFNGGAVKSFPRAATQAFLQPPAQTIQVQVPKGSGPGTQLQASANGLAFNVVVPDGVAEGQMFQVAVPVTPAQPVQATLVNPSVPQPTTGPMLAGFGGDPAAAGGSTTVGENTLLAQMAGMEIKQQVNVAELVTGCEAKNRYHIHNWDPNNPHVPGPFCMLAREESAGFERICCKQNRHLALYVHDGQGEDAAVIMQIHKSFGLAMLPCCRPSVRSATVIVPAYACMRVVLYNFLSAICLHFVQIDTRCR
jgi:hypothetical protein